MCSAGGQRLNQKQHSYGCCGQGQSMLHASLSNKDCDGTNTNRKRKPVPNNRCNRGHVGKFPKRQIQPDDSKSVAGLTISHDMFPSKAAWHKVMSSGRRSWVHFLNDLNDWNYPNDQTTTYTQYHTIRYMFL